MVSPTEMPAAAALPLTPLTTRPPPAALEGASWRARGLSTSTWREWEWGVGSGRSILRERG